MAHFSTVSDFTKWHVAPIAAVQGIDWNPREVGADTYHEIRGIRRILRIIKDNGNGTFPAVLSPRSHQCPEFVGKEWTIPAAV